MLLKHSIINQVIPNLILLLKPIMMSENYYILVKIILRIRSNPKRIYRLISLKYSRMVIILLLIRVDISLLSVVKTHLNIFKIKEHMLHMCIQSLMYWDVLLHWGEFQISKCYPLIKNSNF